MISNSNTKLYKIITKFIVNKPKKFFNTCHYHFFSTIAPRYKNHRYKNTRFRSWKKKKNQSINKIRFFQFFWNLDHIRFLPASIHHPLSTTRIYLVSPPPSRHERKAVGVKISTQIEKYTMRAYFLSRGRGGGKVGRRPLRRWEVQK